MKDILCVLSVTQPSKSWPLAFQTCTIADVQERWHATFQLALQTHAIADKLERWNAEMQCNVKVTYSSNYLTNSLIVESLGGSQERSDGVLQLTLSRGGYG